MPTVAASVTELIDLLAGGRPSRRRAPRRRRRGRASASGDPRPRLDRGLRRRRRRRSRRPAGSSGRRARSSAPDRRASRSSTWPAPAARSRGFTVPAINIRAQTFDMARTVFETAAAGDVGAVILELARSEQTYTYQRPVEYVDERPGRGDRGRLARPGLHPGRPLPVQRHEVRGRPGEDDRGDPARLPAGGRGRLPQHRHRQLDPRRPLPADRRRASSATNYRRAAELTALIRDARAGRRDDQRRRRDRRGRQEELDRGRAAGIPRRLPARARRPPPGAIGISKVSVQTGTSHGGVAAARRRGGRRSSSTSRSSAGSARSPGATAWPAASSTARAPCPDELFHHFPAVETAEIHLATGFQNLLFEHPAFPAELHAAIDALVLRQRRSTSARPTRPTSSSSTRAARRRSGRSSASCGTWPTKDEILAAQRRKIAFLFAELGVDGTRAHGRALRRAGRGASAASGARSGGGRRRLTATRLVSPTTGPMRDEPAARVANARSVVDDGVPRCYPPALSSTAEGVGSGDRVPSRASSQRSVSRRRPPSRRGGGGGSSWRVQSMPPTRSRARRRAPAVARHQAGAAGARSASCRTSRSRSATSASRPGRSPTQAVGLRRRRAGLLLGVAARHPRPDVRRPQLRRAGQPLPGRRFDLPVVEAAVEPDARLVHRLDLLLGRCPDRDRRRRHRAARAVDASIGLRPGHRTSPIPTSYDDVSVHRASSR